MDSYRMLAFEGPSASGRKDAGGGVGEGCPFHLSTCP